MTITVGADTASDKAGDIRDRSALQETLRQFPGLLLIGGRAGATRPLDHGVEIHPGEHRPVLDRTPPADGVRLTQATILGGRQFAHVIPHDTVVIDEAPPRLGMGLLDRRLLRTKGRPRHD